MMKELEEIHVGDVLTVLRDVNLATTANWPSDIKQVIRNDMLVCVEQGVYQPALTAYKLFYLLHPVHGLLQIAYETTLPQSPWNNLFMLTADDF
jgi:hypothetical protein